MHSSTAEAGHFSRRIEARQRHPVSPKDPAGQVGLKAAQGLAGEDSQTNGDQRAGRRIQESMRLGDPDQPVAEVAPRRPNREDLLVLSRAVIDLPVAGRAVGRDDPVAALGLCTVTFIR